MEKEQKAEAKKLIANRKLAYQQTFAVDSQAVKSVLRDLAKFCRANASTFNIDSRVHAVLEGRREVWLRIQQHLQLSEDELFKLLSGG